MSGYKSFWKLGLICIRRELPIVHDPTKTSWTMWGKHMLDAFEWSLSFGIVPTQERNSFVYDLNLSLSVCTFLPLISVNTDHLRISFMALLNIDVTHKNFRLLTNICTLYRCHMIYIAFNLTNFFFSIKFSITRYSHN